VATVSGTLTLSGTGIPGLVSNASANKSFPASAFDGTIDFGGTSGHDFGSPSTTGTNTATISDAATLAANGTSTNNNFGEVKPASLSGFVYVDSNNDGVKGGNEAGIANVTVTLTGSDDQGVVTRIVTTDQNGFYSLTNLRPGTYTLTESQPAFYIDGKDTVGTPGGQTGNDQFNSIILTQGTDGQNNNFGELQAASLAGFVYVDGNNDGIKGGNELGIGGVTVTLSGFDDRGAAVSQSTTTAGDGSYSFTNLRPGSYNLTESQPALYLDGKDTVGTPGGQTTNDKFSNVFLASGVNGINNNFGELQAASLGGFVYADRNNNGFKDGNELASAARW